MKKNSKFWILLFVTLFAACLVACSTGDAGSEDESSSVDTQGDGYFLWDNDYICGLTDKGAKQEELVIPSNCVGFIGTIFADKENSVKKVRFESDKDIELNGVFTCAEGVEYIELPDELTEIMDMEFWCCTSLKEITLPAGITVVDAYAFQDSTALEKVVFTGENITIRENAFEGCSALKTVLFPDSLQEIGAYAFYACTALEDVSLPQGLKTLGEFAFANSGLKNVTVPAEMELTTVDTTALAQSDHAVTVKVTEDSWADKNFDEIFAGCCNKEY